MGETKALVDEFNEISMKFAEHMDDDEMNRLLERGELQSAIDAAQGWDLERTLEIAADACACRPGMRTSPSSPAGSGAGWPCASCCPNPDMLLLDELPTTSMRNRWAGSAFLTECPGTVVAITHDRYFLDNAAQWILELDRVGAFPTKATSPGSRPRKRLASQASQPPAD